MNPQAASTSFRERIQARLDRAQAGLDERRRKLDREMAELEEDTQRFHHVAGQLFEQVLLPAMQDFAAYFENARLESRERAPRIRCQLRHCLRFPALANVEFSIVPGPTRTAGTVVRYHAEILPVFIQFERDDEFRVPLEGPQQVAVRDWAEEKLLGFLDAYLPIETHQQYQSHNVATDPVCGMQVPKPQALTYGYADKTYYFCAQRCLDRFIAAPDEYVSVEAP